MRTVLLVCSLMLTFPPLASSQALPAGNAKCESTRVPEPIMLIGGRLREAPDLSPELQRLNLMSNVNGCIDYAYAKIAAYNQEHPEDVGVQFLAARYLWRYGDIEGGIKLLEGVVREHPDFASGYILLGAMHVERSSLTPARENLRRGLTISPDDLWGNINLLKLKVLTGDDVNARNQLVEIALAEQAPEFARSSTTDFLLRKMDPFTAGAEYESLLRLKLGHVQGHFREEAMFDLAWFLIIHERHAEARPILEPLLKSPNLDLLAVRALMAESYLREAARIAPTITAANQNLVAQARAVVDNDFSRLTAGLTRTPEVAAKLAPFIQNEKVDVDARDAFGHTRLCNAAQMGDLLLIQDLIREGADVNLMCGTMTALAIAAGTGNADIETRKTMFGYLLQNGADPDHAHAHPGEAATIEYQCESGTECAELMPMLKAYRQATAKPN